jgi:hypothetical protein
MPQVLILMAAGVGLYTAYKWVAREVGKAAEAADRAHDDLRHHADAVPTGAPKDLGELIYDEKTGAYRPKG